MDDLDDWVGCLGGHPGAWLRAFDVGKITHGIPLNAVVDVAGPKGNPKPPNDVRFNSRSICVVAGDSGR